MFRIFRSACAVVLAGAMYAACSSSDGSAGGTNPVASGGSAATDGGGAGGRGGAAGTAATGGGGGGSGGAAGSAGASGSGGAGGAGGVAPGGLKIQGNRILGPDGKPFHGRGANLPDTRSCNACAYTEPNVEGLNRWADELIDNWKANFIRFTLESYDAAEGRVHWQSLLKDASYLADIKTAVTHMTSKPGVYVMITVFIDPTIDYDTGWPTEATIPVYEKLAETFADNPGVLFGLTNEPFADESQNPQLEQLYLEAIDAIRAVEKAHGAPEHVVVVQAPQMWSRYLDYFLEKPLARTQVAYEVHAYNPESDFEDLVRIPSQKLPILIGEHGPSQYSSDSDIRALWALCKELEVPHIAWTFHQRCPPNLLEDTGEDSCLRGPNYDFPRTSWGDMLFEYLQTPW
jgi:cellulase (glycosyl hydrolase family 5)